METILFLVSWVVVGKAIDWFLAKLFYEYYYRSESNFVDKIFPYALGYFMIFILFIVMFASVEIKIESKFKRRRK